ncbi:glycosyl transferase family 9 [Emticicia oligotrophica DSM 17448]|uniref:Glycosyl transferase family 9 n=1 Tax=Emticicia oligotrophica (strain DSM 17448 / CIP 109782 / MTCC 6937 / GPTSA100-15) TaxID=929562 RepID=A0ABM5N3K7_EMTOG|nr:glycosyltransferase family 9 protein [Emticicia oligotrophica]AFK04055.1 glycosyl transferase family 9 [Emticicia oligotrophica DSM 17448]
MRKYCGTPKETIPFRIMDFFVDIYANLFYKKRKLAPINHNSPRILIASLGHLGDALTVTYMFPLIKKTYPNASIDLLTAQWCEPVNLHNPHINQTIYINHFQTNRRKISSWEKIKDFYRTFRQALPLLCQNDYDYYIDIRYSDAVAHFVLPFISVKKAYGFSRRALGGLLDIEFDVPTHEFHHFDMYFMLLREIDVKGSFADIEPYFPIPPNVSFEKIQEKIGLANKPFLMLFPESGGEHKQLSVEFWAKIIDETLKAHQLNVLLCGQTQMSKQILDLVDGAHKQNIIDTSAKINIQEIAVLSKNAKFALTLDSFPEHLCCIFSQTITIFKGTGYPFFPLANFPVYLIHNHKPSVGMTFERDNVEVVYQENVETDAVKALVLNKISKLLHE